MDPADHERITLYGICPICGAARDLVRTEHYETDGTHTVAVSLTCTADPQH